MWMVNVWAFIHNRTAKTRAWWQCMEPLGNAIQGFPVFHGVPSII